MLRLPTARYPRDGSSSRRAETSASSLRTLATASPGAEPSIRHATLPASRKLGEKRGCGRVWRWTGHDSCKRGGARRRKGSWKRGSPTPRRRVAIAKRLRRSLSSSKVGEKRKRNSSPPSSSSSIRSTALDPIRTRLDLHISIAYTFDLLLYFVMRCVFYTVFRPCH
jgi:hypothetical protein